MKRPRLTTWLARAWQWLRGRFHRRRVFHIKAVEELPDVLQVRVLYAVGMPTAPWSAALLCPCGCRDTIHLSLLPDDHPCWVLTVDRSGVPTLHPSVWRRAGCRAHFFLKKGKVHWCGDV